VVRRFQLEQEQLAGDQRDEAPRIDRLPEICFANVRALRQETEPIPVRNPNVHRNHRAGACRLLGRVVKE
jgi:hypothetical protein